MVYSPEGPARGTGRGSVLIVDDEPSVLAVYRQLLDARHECRLAGSVAEALEMLRARPSDVVLADVMMPEADGFELLRRVREIDLDLPVILITGFPTLDSAIRAVEKGAYRFLVKPVGSRELLEAVNTAVQQRQFARAHREARAILGHQNALPADEAGREAWIDEKLRDLRIHVQPIFELRSRSLYAVEGLARFLGPERTGVEEFLRALEGAGRLREFGRLARKQAARLVDELPGAALFFLNLHQDDLLDDELYDRESSLARRAGRVVLEVTERGSVGELPDLAARLRSLRELGFRMAVDDLGAGNNGLATFSQVEPDYVKLDRILVQGAAANPRLFQVVVRLCELSRELGARIVAEGVETAAQEAAVSSAGSDYVQGWLYGRAAPLAEALAAGAQAPPAGSAALPRR